MKFTISKIICDCGNEISIGPTEHKDYEWILVACEKCGLDRAYQLDFVCEFKQHPTKEE